MIEILIVYDVDDGPDRHKRDCLSEVPQVGDYLHVDGLRAKVIERMFLAGGGVEIYCQVIHKMKKSEPEKQETVVASGVREILNLYMDKWVYNVKCPGLLFRPSRVYLSDIASEAGLQIGGEQVSVDELKNEWMVYNG
jgi:hypothetical protein